MERQRRTALKRTSMTLLKTAQDLWRISLLMKMSHLRLRKTKVVSIILVMMREDAKLSIMIPRTKKKIATNSKLAKPAPG